MIGSGLIQIQGIRLVHQRPRQAQPLLILLNTDAQVGIAGVQGGGNSSSGVGSTVLPDSRAEEANRACMNLHRPIREATRE